MGRKIGILTHHYICNFGAFLQAYALAEAVRKIFPDDEVWIINHLNIKHFLINTAGWFRFYRGRENIKMWLEKIRLPYTFSKARKKYMKMTPLCFGAKKINAENFDCIIVGSDEVWNYTDPKACNRLKFGIGLECGKLISYAPSAGKTSPLDPVPDHVIRGIRSFDSISARDTGTAGIVEKITGKDCTMVLDPVFLADFPRAKKKVPKGRYILFYYCDKLPGEILKSIIEFAGKNDYMIFGAGECSKIYDWITVNITPFEWVELFRHAEYVFTGTFHGAVFSILYRKQFACHLTNEGRKRKVSDLLMQLEIGSRTLTPELEVMDDPIDYDNVYRIIDEKKKISLRYLTDSIGMD